MLKVTGVDSKKVVVDSFLPLNIKWGNPVVELIEIAVVKSCPSVLILGLDWIIKSKKSLIAENDKIVLKSSDAYKSKKRFVLLGLKRSFVCEEEENPLFVSDELIESLEKDAQQEKR